MELVDLLKRLAVVAAIVVVVLSVAGRRLGLLEFRPGGSAFDTYVRPAFLAIFVVAFLLALRWEVAGAGLAAFAAAGLIAFASQQLVTRHAVLMVVAFAIPAILWLVIDIVDLDRMRAAVAVGLVLGLAVVGYQVGDYAYDRVWGPTHPETRVEALPESPVEWVWSGGVTAMSAEVRAKGRALFESARLAVSDDPGLSDVRWVDGTDGGPGVVGFAVGGLDPDTTYHYAVELDGNLDLVRSGTFTTFPEEGRPASFRVAFGACARVGSNGAVFDTIGDLDPLLYSIIGDFHYGDNEIDDVADYRDVLDITLTQPAQANLYRSTPIAYVWDDHDYGANDSAGDAITRRAALASYREYVPSYELAGTDNPIYQAFTIGRVRFVFTDARAGRDAQAEFDDENKTMLGAEQKAWLKEELLEGSRRHELVVWVNPVPWVAEASAGADNWGGYATERRELAEFVADNGIANLVMVSGDAHMVAIDDGTNTNFSSQPGPAFPLLHAAALDRPGGTKGGPYSEGAIAGGGQFGLLEVIDDGDRMEVVLSARDWRGEVLLEHRVAVTELVAAAA